MDVYLSCIALINEGVVNIGRVYTIHSAVVKDFSLVKLWVTIIRIDLAVLVLTIVHTGRPSDVSTYT